jgi:hypothetical protein
MLIIVLQKYHKKGTAVLPDWKHPWDIVKQKVKAHQSFETQQV